MWSCGLHKISVNRHQISPMQVNDSSPIEQPDVGDGELAVPRDGPKHVEQHPVLAVGLRIKVQYLISDVQITCLCSAMADLCLGLSTSTASCVWLPVLVLKTCSTLMLLVV